MQQIFKFIEKYKYFLLFLFLEFFALFFTIQNHSYHRSKFINSANSITGGIYKKTSSISDFLNLIGENQRLSEENTRLKNILSLSQYNIDSLTLEKIDSTNFFQKFRYTTAKITNNSFNKRNNFLTINKGTKHDISPELGVVNSKGVIGVINNVSKNNSTVISILNKYSQTNVKLKNNDHFGTLSWDGKDYRTIQLLDLPRQAIISVGDTIITGGKSTIFPEGILVGHIKDYKIEDNVYKYINITLFNDMSSLSYVNIITNLEKEEIRQLEAKNE